MSLILIRSGEGFNEVVTAAENASEFPGVLEFNKLLAEAGRLPRHQLILELGQALKVPWKELAELSDSNGYVTGDATVNLREYFEDALTYNQWYFLKRQCGKAGELNNKPLEYETGSDPCG